MDEDLSLSTFTLKRKLERHGFINSYDEEKDILRISGIKLSFWYLFQWTYAPFLLFTANILLSLASFAESKDPKDFIDLVTIIALIWQTVGWSIARDRKRLNRTKIELGQGMLKISENNKEWIYDSKEIVSITIEDSDKYKKGGMYLYRRGNLAIETTSRTHRVIYLYGEKLISNWDDLRYFQKHFSELLSPS